MGKTKSIIPAISNDCEFTSGEYCAEFGGNWDHDEEVEFGLSFDDPRYKRALELAHELKSKYPLTGLDPEKDREKIMERERIIVTAVVDKIHEEYGHYNPHVAAGDFFHSSLHQDDERANTGRPADLNEFNKDELICRHYGPLAAALCTEAGMEVYTVTGHMNSYHVLDGKPQNINERIPGSVSISENEAPAKDDLLSSASFKLSDITPLPASLASSADRVLPQLQKFSEIRIPPKDGEEAVPLLKKSIETLPVAASRDVAVGHLYVISRMSGNIIEPTTNHGKDAYRVNISGDSIEEVLAGNTVVVMDRYGMSTYGAYRQHNPEQDRIYNNRLEMLKKGEQGPLETHITEVRGRSIEEVLRKGNTALLERARKTAEYDDKLVEEVYERKAKPQFIDFHRAARKGDLDQVKHIMKSFPILDIEKQKAFSISLFEQKNAGVAAFLINDVVKGNLPEGELHEYAKIKLLVTLDEDERGKKLDKTYHKELIDKLDITPSNYLGMALREDRTGHIGLAMEMTPVTELSDLQRAFMRSKAQTYARRTETKELARKMEAYIGPETEQERQSAKDQEQGLFSLSAGGMTGAAVLGAGGLIVSMLSGLGAITTALIGLGLGAAGFIAGNYMQAQMGKNNQNDDAFQHQSEEKEKQRSKQRERETGGIMPVNAKDLIPDSLRQVAENADEKTLLSSPLLKVIKPDQETGRPK